MGIVKLKRMTMSSTTTYKLVKMGVMIALVAGSAVACHYKAGNQYANDDRSDSTNMPADAATANSTTPSNSSPTSAAKASNGSPTSATAATTATTKPVSKAKFAHGRASVMMPKIYTAAEVAPQFPGGARALDNYINKSVNYPQQAIDDDVSGTVHVSFIVDEKGHVTKAKVLDAANVGDGLDQEALRVVKNMPAWMPGTVKGKKVKTRMELPISFQVES
jgi:protein TonB